MINTDKLRILIIVLLLTFNLSQSQEINWVTLDEVAETYEENPKPIFVLWTADWCKPCLKFKPILDWESPFRRELRHFHSLINGKEINRAPLINAKLDISLNIDIIKSYIENSEIDVKN